MTRDPARTALILAEWNRGNVSRATLSVRWGVPLVSLNAILRGGRKTEAAPAPQPTAPLQYETAFSINDLTTDAYRIVSRCRLERGLNSWHPTLPEEEIRRLKVEVAAGRIFAPQKLFNGELVRLARVWPIVARKRGRK